MVSTSVSAAEREMKSSFDVLPLIEEGKHVGSEEERCLLRWVGSRREDALERRCRIRKNAELPYVWLPKHGLEDQLGSV